MFRTLTVLTPIRLFFDEVFVVADCRYDANNYYDYCGTRIPFDAFFSALSKDKKNTTEDFVFILPAGDNAEIQKHSISRKSSIESICRNFLSGEMNK